MDNSVTYIDPESGRRRMVPSIVEPKVAWLGLDTSDWVQIPMFRGTKIPMFRGIEPRESTLHVRVATSAELANGYNTNEQWSIPNARTQY